MDQCNIFEFANGIRFIHKYVPYTKVAHEGFILDVGSRNETTSQIGLAHFWEHMAFKGTSKRSAYEILNTLENVGGELNAYTTKEKICFYASCLDRHYEKTLSLLTDITFHSIFPEKQVELERGVILEEISMYSDSPDDSLQDDFDGILFANHPLGNNILGTPLTVSAFKKNDFQLFYQENVQTERLIFSSLSNLPFPKALSIARKHLENLPKLSTTKQREPFVSYVSKHQTLQKPISQAHQAIGRTAYCLHEEKRIPFFMLNNLLGGPALNSRLNLALREKNGLVYGIESAYTPYTDTGDWGVFFATEAKNLEKANALVFKEIRKLKSQKLSHMQLHNLQQQVLGQMVIADENNLSFMLMMGRSILDIGKVDTLKEVFEQVESVTAESIWEVANEIFDENQFSTLTYLPE